MDAKSTAEVIHEECTELGRQFDFSRAKHNCPAALHETQDVLAKAAENQGAAPLTALCLSGGGIRSATFNLGVVQELARLGVLGKFDYLSTVSGGGYLGSWLSAWIYRQQGIAGVVDGLKAPNRDKSEEAPQIRHLRAYSNYLSPQMGLLSADTWTLFAIWLRNTMLNWLVLIPTLMAVLMLPHLYAWFAENYASTISWEIVVGFAAIAVFYVICNLPTFTKLLNRQSQAQNSFLWFCLLPVFLLGIFIPVIPCIKDIFTDNLAVRLTLAPPIIWGGVFIGMTIITAIASKLLKGGDGNREWSARSSAWLLMLSLAWLALCGVSLGGSWLLITIKDQWLSVMVAGVASGVISAILGKGEATAATAQAAQRMQREGKSSSVKTFLLPFAATIFILIFLSGISLFSLWLISELSTWEQFKDIIAKLPPALTGMLPQWEWLNGEALTPADAYLHSIGTFNPTLWLGIFMFFGMVAGFFIQINKFSLHAMYRNRLMRAYLGASREPNDQAEAKACFFPLRKETGNSGNRRNANRFTGFDENDNLYMKDLAGRKPLLVVNTALNLVHGRQLAWQDRKAESFTITPLHAGSSAMEQMRGAYRPVGEYTSHQGLTLATAMSVSGAAASPNMGYQSSPALAFVMALFNVRLGWWIGNPKLNSWKKAGPTAARFQLVREALGLTDDDGKWVYLSDGGHFENLGLYEMALRRCRYIVLCDAGADPDFTYEDLGNAIHKIRVDLGVDIELMKGESLDIGLRDKEPPYCHHARFSIRYDRLHAGAEKGELLYIKPAFYNKEKNTPVDVYHYAQGSNQFPHETTADQFFSESQFESYRELGVFSMQQITGINPESEIEPGSVKELISLAAKAVCKIETDQRKEG